MTRLQIGAEVTTLGAATLTIGWRTLARAYFKSDPPSPLDLENAIAAIEDEIARAGRAAMPSSAVAATDETIREIASACGADAVLHTEAVERAFTRLAGRAGVPGSPRVAATLVILRELMHHLQIDSIRVAQKAG